MPIFAKCYLIFTGLLALAGALLHNAIMMGGPAWYDFFGAPEGLVHMARAGNFRAPISCLVIASTLSVFAAYAFSGAGLVKRLPLLLPVMALIATVLILRGLVFAPVILWRPELLSGICDCRSIDTFIVVTSLICLAMGIGFAIGAIYNRRLP